MADPAEASREESEMSKGPHGLVIKEDKDISIRDHE
jgi:hypothetical protein